MNIDAPQIQGGFVLPGMKKRQTDARTVASHRVPGFNWLPDRVRNPFIAMCGEFAGTFLFLFFAYSGTQVANTQTQGASGSNESQAPNPAQLLYISLCFGFSLAVNAWVFFRISGGLFNPAVTFGMCLVGALSWLRGGLLFVSQILGGIASAGVVSCLFPGALNVRTSLGGGTTITQGLFIEMFLTAQLVFTIFMLAAEKHKGTFIAPVGIGLSLFIAELTGVYYTGGSVNPARSFGPCVVLHSFYHYHWIYWVGPILGAILASGFYKFIKTLEYETANPGQDLDDREAQVFDPDKDITRPHVALGQAEYIVQPDGRVVHSSDSSNENPSQAGYPTPTQNTSASDFATRIPHASTSRSGKGGQIQQSRRSADSGEGANLFQAGPSIEAGKHFPRQAGHA